MKLHKYTLNELQTAIASSVSVRQVLQKLNVKTAGGNYATFHKAVSYFKLDTSHFTGMNLSGRSLPKRRKAISEYLQKDTFVKSTALKRYLIENKIFPEECSSCELEVWLDSKIPLELDHIDGNHTNNQLSNLRLLCPNCHAFTPTYRRKKSSLNKA